MRQQLGSIIGGLVGGLLGTAAMHKGMDVREKLPESLRPPDQRIDPGEYIVERVEARRGRALSLGAHQRAAQGLGWVYGMSWSSLLSLVAPRIGMHKLGRAVAAGAALGAGVWAVGYLGWLPRAGIVGSPRDENMSRHASAIVSHVVYGVLCALPIYAANRVLDERA